MSAATCPDCGAALPEHDPPVSSCPSCGADLSSVRPPDRSAEDLPPGDPLEGWDRAPSGPPPSPAGSRDGGAVVLAGLVGLAVGLAATGRGRGALLGALGGVAVGLVARRSWNLDPPDDAWAMSRQG